MDAGNWGCWWWCFSYSQILFPLLLRGSTWYSSGNSLLVGFATSLSLPSIELLKSGSPISMQVMISRNVIPKVSAPYVKIRTPNPSSHFLDRSLLFCSTSTTLPIRTANIKVFSVPPNTTPLSTMTFSLKTLISPLGLIPSSSPHPQIVHNDHHKTPKLGSLITSQQALFLKFQLAMYKSELPIWIPIT